MLSDAICSKYINPAFLFYAIFRLADYSSDSFYFRLQKRDKEVAPNLHKIFVVPFSPLVFKYAINRNCFGDLYLWCERRFLKIVSTPLPTALTSAPNPLLHPWCKAPQPRSLCAPSINLKLASLNRG